MKGERPQCGGFAKLRGKDSNLDYLIQRNAERGVTRASRHTKPPVFPGVSFVFRQCSALGIAAYAAAVRSR